MNLSKTKAFAVIILIAVVLSACKTQKETAVLKIYQNKKLVESVSPQDFMAVFTKNNISNDSVTKESIDEYLNLFINYKLKVKEAEALGMDTLPSFVSELKGYRDQLARPYLSDQTVTDRLISEAYDRMLYDVRASHILITLNKDASPADTLKAWQKATEAREKLLAGEQFASIAAQYSDDPYARDIPASETSPGRKGNQGDLGYFTVFDMVYPFENGAYETPVGGISPIVRSVFGYHILKVTDKKPAMGRAFVAHIYVAFPKTREAADSLASEKKINDIYQEFLKGEHSFEDLAKTWSEDQSNAQNGGVIRWFNVHGLVPEFVAVLKDMKPGDVSAPVKTMYGWHIIKLLEEEKPGSFDKELPNIKQRISKDSRSMKSREEAIAQVKTQFGFKEYPANKSLLYRGVDSSVFNGSWKFATSSIAKSKAPLFKIGDETITVAQFGNWLENRQTRTGTGEVIYFVNERMKEFTDDKILEYKEKRLDNLYPEFRNLMREYRDGILLFDLMDKKVWSYALRDTVGLQAYYEEHKQDHLWGLRVDAAVFVAQTEPIAQQALALLKAGKTTQEILDSINKESSLNLTIRSDKFQAGDNPLVDANPWVMGTTAIFPTPAAYQGTPGFAFVHYYELLPPGPKQLQEVRGIMISQYQEQLEKQWLAELKQKYQVEVNTPELEKLYQQPR